MTFFFINFVRVWLPHGMSEILFVYILFVPLKLFPCVFLPHHIIPLKCYLIYSFFPCCTLLSTPQKMKNFFIDKKCRKNLLILYLRSIYDECSILMSILFARTAVVCMCMCRLCSLFCFAVV